MPMEELEMGSHTGENPLFGCMSNASWSVQREIIPPG